MPTCGIYAWIHEPTGRRYIGQSCKIESRRSEHRSRLNKGTNPCIVLQLAWAKYGEAAFRFEVVEECARDVLTEREQHWMDYYRAGGLLNAAPAAGSLRGYKQSPEIVAKRVAKMTGMKRSPESCRRISEAQLGRVSPKRGTTLPPETRAKISAAQVGRTHSAERRANISAGLIGNANTKGRPLSDGHKAKISAANLNPDPETTRKRSEANTGQRRTPETRARMAASQLGKRATPETRAKLSAGRRGKVISQETKAKIAASVRATLAAKRATAASAPK